MKGGSAIRRSSASCGLRGAWITPAKLLSRDDGRGLILQVMSACDESRFVKLFVALWTQTCCKLPALQLEKGVVEARWHSSALLLC